ncbi:MAG: S-layer homology domain-containing protein [Ruminococcaceae bacterium]|nr:S-layer homology domain-containing protein [Oscillospiraceae bacterium]
MKKRIAIFLTMLQLFAFSAGALDLTEAQKEDLFNAGIMTGDETGDLRLADTITRAESVKMLCVAGNLKLQDVSAEPLLFPDVQKTHWAASYIQAARNRGLVAGDETGFFHPESSVTNEEFVKMLVCLLGYEPKTIRGGYPAGYTAVAAELGITENLQLAAGAAASRNDVAIMVQRALDTPLMVTKHDSSADVAEYIVMNGENGVPLSTLRKQG